MVTARSGTTFEAALEGANPGLAGTVALTVDNPDGTPAIARSTAGIVELSTGDDPGAGVYLATRTAPVLDEDVPQATYTLIWDLGDPDNADETYTETLLVWAAPSFPYLPSADEVATLLRARTRTTQGREFGQFSDETTPTDVQVARLIEVAATDVAIEVGTTFASDDLEVAARRAVALKAAMLVELSYYPEQVNNDQSAYDQLLAMYQDVIAKLSARVDDNAPGQARVYSVPVTSQTLAAARRPYLVDADL